MAEVDVIKINSGKKISLKDKVTEEAPLTLYLNGEELVTLLCSPDSLKELSIGFLYSSGLLKSKRDIKKVTVDTKNWASYVELKSGNKDVQGMFKRLYTSGCGRGTIFYNALDFMHKKKIDSKFEISSPKIIKLMDAFQKKSAIFKETGGVHSAALACGDDILAFKEDIGRHNALDKVIGEALLKDIGMKNVLMLTSGRISSEIVLKAQKTESPIMVSRSAPTDQAIKLAAESNLTLVGFARGQRMNVYTGGERIVAGGQK